MLAWGKEKKISSLYHSSFHLFFQIWFCFLILDLVCHASWAVQLGRNFVPSPNKKRVLLLNKFILLNFLLDPFLPLSKNGHQRKAYLSISCSILFSFCLLGGSLLPLNWEISSRNWIVNNSYLIDCSLALPCLWLCVSSFYLSIPLAISINLYKWNCLILFGLLDTLLTQSNLCLSSLGPCILCLWNHHLRPIPMDLIRLVDFLNTNVIGDKNTGWVQMGKWCSGFCFTYQW